MELSGVEYMKCTLDGQVWLFWFWEGLSYLNSICCSTILNDAIAMSTALLRVMYYI